jgi:hypothetical protein
MMTDRELLELAAKSAGIALEFDNEGEPCFWGDYRGLPQKEMWNPLTDDGDAQRLAVKLRIDVEHLAMEVFAVKGEMVIIEPNDDPYAATRRAIVRAAAEIGKQI